MLRFVPISLFSSDFFRSVLLVFENTPIPSDLFRFLPICSDLFSEQIRSGKPLSADPFCKSPIEPEVKRFLVYFCGSSSLFSAHCLQALTRQVITPIFWATHDGRREDLDCPTCSLRHLFPELLFKRFSKASLTIMLFL